MKFLDLGSIRKNLTFMVVIAVLPALAILFYTGTEQRRLSIEKAAQEVLLLTNSMAEGQRDIANSTRQILSTLSLLPAIQALDIKKSSEIFRAVLEQNPAFQNITLTDLNGKVLASGLPFAIANLGDRKHVRDALSNKNFAVGEYIVTRVGKKSPAFPFAYPVLNENGSPTAILTTAIKLARFSKFHDASTLPKKSFVGVTDHKGIRLFFYPPKTTNPVGEPIKANSWNIASKAQEPGIFISEGSDGARRIFAFEQVRLSPGTEPYMYVWAAIPEASVLAPVVTALTRNLLLMLLGTLTALFIAWMIGKNTLIAPIKSLEIMTRKFAEGNLESYDGQAVRADEFGKLTKSFYDMAKALTKTQETLRNNEARFRLIMDSINSLIYVADMNTHEVLFVNEYGRKKLGDVTGKICWQSIQKGQSGPCTFCTDKYLVDGEGNPKGTYTWEFKNTTTGHSFYINDRAIQWVDGRIVRLEIATDITKLKQIEEDLYLTKFAMDHSADSAFWSKPDGNFVYVNDAACRSLGYTKKELMAMTVNDFDPNFPPDSWADHWKELKEKGSILVETTHQTKDGRLFPVEVSASYVEYEGEEYNCSIVRDISYRKETERKLLKVKKLESVGVLAGGIAHDFNNILSAIMGNINLALLDTNLENDTKKFLSEAEKASIRAKGLTHQLLTFAKGGEPIKETASLKDIITDSANFVLQGDRVACSFSFPDQLWLAEIDKGQVSQVIQNLVINASHAMPEGGTIKITCENVTLSDNSRPFTLDEGKYIKLCVQDSGIGMAANVLENIFDPYFSTKDKGSGLGLAISLSIINKHQGDMVVKSTPGIGTTFTIYLPATDKVEPEKQETIETNKSFPKSKILLMDDDEMVRNVVKGMLTTLGHEVVFASGGREAIKSYKESINLDDRFDLVIMDLTIPGGMGGKEAVQEILKLDKEAKVIVSSGYHNDPIMANYKDHGFCLAIAKPFKLAELTNIIRQV